MTYKDYLNKTLVISEESTGCKRVVSNKLIEQVIKVDYLGINLSSHGCLEDEVRQKVIKTNREEECLNDTIWRNKHLTIETKSKICKTTISPIMTYKLGQAQIRYEDYWRQQK